MINVLFSVNFLLFVFGAVLHLVCAIRLATVKDLLLVIYYWVTMVVGLLWIGRFTGFSFTIWTEVDLTLLFALIGVVASIIGFFMRGKKNKKVLRILLIGGSALFAIAWASTLTVLMWLRTLLDEFEISTKDLYTLWFVIAFIMLIVGLILMATSERGKRQMIVGLVITCIGALIILLMFLQSMDINVI